MLRTITVLNNKGGVGKTTIVSWLAQVLAMTGHRVLIIDNDFQHNTSNAFRVSDYSKTIVNLYQTPTVATLAECIQSTAIQGIDIIPSVKQLSRARIPDPKLYIKLFSESFITKEYDFVIWDNNPGLTYLQECTVLAANVIVLPVEMAMLAIQGTNEMINVLRKEYRIAADRFKIVPNKYRAHTRHSAYYGYVKRQFPDITTTVPIPFSMVFDDMEYEKKHILYNRFKSKPVPHIIKAVTQILPETFEDNEALGMRLMDKNKEHKANVSRRNTLKRMAAHAQV